MTIAGYDMEQLLGQGSAGAVYRGRCQRTNRRVAIKLLAEAADPDGLRRFERERRALAEADHPALIRVLDWGVSEHGQPYLVMPFLEGARPLGEWIYDQWQEGRPPDLRGRVLRILRDLCGALDHLHARGVVHRDVKPSNVMIKPSGNAVLIDLGLAHLAGSRLTVDGMQMGTPAYSAPELLRGDPVSPATDVYLVGLLMQELLTGQRASSNLTAFLQAIAEGRRPFPPPSAWNPALGPAIDEVARRATEAVPRERFAKAGEVVEALAAVPEAEWARASGATEGKPTERIEHAQPAKSRQRTLVGMASPVPSRFPLGPALLAAALIAAGLVAVRGRPAALAPQLVIEPGFRSVEVRVGTAEASAGRLTIQPVAGATRVLGESTPLREHRFVVDALPAGELVRFTFHDGVGGEPVSASAVGPEAPRLLGLTLLAGRARPTLLLEVTRPIEGELELVDGDGGNAVVPLARLAVRHEIALPAGNWSGAVTARVRARSALGEVEELPGVSLRVR